MNLSEAVHNLNIKFILNLFDLEMQLSFLQNLRGDHNGEGQREQCEGLPEKERQTERQREEKQTDRELKRLKRFTVSKRKREIVTDAWRQRDTDTRNH